NPSLNHRYRKGIYSLFKTLQQNHIKRCEHGQKAMQTWTKSDVVFRIYPKKEKVCEFISKN
ncbi:TPA: hypothetical protein ACF6IX_002814, partial [Enterococcus faecium]